MRATETVFKQTDNGYNNQMNMYQYNKLVVNKDCDTSHDFETPFKDVNR